MIGTSFAFSVQHGIGPAILNRSINCWASEMKSNMTRLSVVVALVFLSAVGAVFAKDGKDFGFSKAEQLIEKKKYEAALEVLQAGTSDDDIYPCMCWDAPHEHRSSKRRLAIVDCLLHLKREEDAREELKSLYQDKSKPGYNISGDAHILLIELETKHGYPDFERWLQEHRPVDKKYYQGSIQRITSLKKGIESGKFDGVIDIFRNFPTYHIFAPRRFSWQQKAVVSYMVAQDKQSLPFLCGQMTTQLDKRFAQLNRGVVYSLGELGSVESIPVLREALRKEKNYYTRLEVILALAKSGDKEITAELYRHKVGNLDHQRYVDNLLRRLTGKNFGDIKDQDSAKKVFEQWGIFIDQKKSAQQDAAAEVEKPRC